MKTITLLPLQKPTKKRVKIPGSKSYTNRALFIAALSGTRVKIINPLTSEDTKAMTECLKKIKTARMSRLDCNLSGTTIRFMLALSAITPGTQILYGKEGLNNRPIGNLVEALTQLGAKIKYLKNIGFPPVKVLSSKLHPGTVKMNGSVSSQFISAILMIAPLVGEITIKIIGKQISKPYIDMTIDAMGQFGVKVIKKHKEYVVPKGQRYNAKKYVVEGDLSSAGYFAAIAALTKSTIILENINPDSKQADMEFLKILEGMGNRLIRGQNQITVIGKIIKPVNIDMANCPDQIQTLAVLASFVKGVTKISGCASLRIKETNRMLALREQLRKMGIKTQATKNTLTVSGGNPKAAQIDTYGDHRMAMSFAVAGSKLSNMKIVDPDVVNKTFPEFWEKLNLIGIKTKLLSAKNIILIGMRGSGKTTTAKQVAKKLKTDCLELDKMLSEKVGLPIAEIIKKYGWNFFRNKESEIAEKASKYCGKIISTGGGIVTREKNIETLKKNGIIIFLNASLTVLVKRSKAYANQPRLTDKKNVLDEVKTVLQQRLSLYKKAADITINTDSLNPSQVADIITQEVKALI